MSRLFVSLGQSKKVIVFVFLIAVLVGLFLARSATVSAPDLGCATAYCDKGEP